jgi:hypothetical protein
LRESRYQHSTKVRADDGVYHWDCSGMTGWILRRAAPAAFRRLGRGRPVARDFVSVIERAPTDRARAGWQRIAHIADVMPGDVFAWRRPRGLPSKNTGHVGIVLDRPLPVPGLPGGWAVRIADSSSFTHQDDSRRDDPDGGFGIGSITFLVDADDADRVRPRHPVIAAASARVTSASIHAALSSGASIIAQWPCASSRCTGASNRSAVAAGT